MSETQKHTKPNVPNLRFPGFEGEWERKQLSVCCEIYDGTHQTPKYTKTGIPFVSVEDITALRTIEKKFISEDNYKRDFKIAPQAGDILMTRIGDIGTSRVVTDNSPLAYYVSLALLRPIGIEASFLNSYIPSPYFKRELYRRTIHVAFPQKINKEDIGKCLFAHPSIDEQSKIGSFLSLLDQRIDTQSKLIDRYESLIRAIILRSQLSSSSRKVYLHEILTERKELNEQGYDICSVSVSKGVVNQVEYLGRSFAAKETTHYHVVHKGDIVYTKSPTGEFPYGIIKQSYLDAPVAVSPLYGVYEPIDYLTGVYLHHFFCSPQNAKNYLHKLIQKGAKNTINITNQHFLDNYISIPESDTLQSIVAIIETLSKRVDLEKELLSLFIEQKAYLMSNMFI